MVRTAKYVCVAIISDEYSSINKKKSIRIRFCLLFVFHRCCYMHWLSCMHWFCCMHRLCLLSNFRFNHSFWLRCRWLCYWLWCLFHFWLWCFLNFWLRCFLYFWLWCFFHFWLWSFLNFWRFLYDGLVLFFVVVLFLMLLFLFFRSCCHWFAGNRCSSSSFLVSKNCFLFLSNIHFSSCLELTQIFSFINCFADFSRSFTDCTKVWPATRQAFWE